jgi:2-dehydropantoate 2-reductase
VLRYGVVGSGAVGCFYGIRLAAAGAPVQFLFRHGAEFVRARGMRLDSPDLGHPSIAADWEALDPCDVLILATKATANPDVMAHLAPRSGRLVEPGGGILLVQNGIGAEEAIAQAASGRQVLGGLAFLCARQVGPGHVEHLDYGTLTIAVHEPGEVPGGVTDLMRAIAADLAAARTGVNLDEDLVRARWRKLMWNVSFNPLSVILDAATDALVGDPGTEALIRTLMGEVSAAAAAEGRSLPDTLPGELLEATRRMAPYATSMKIDADAGRPLEVDAMLGEPLRRASRSGAAMPVVSALHHQLAFLDRRISERRRAPGPATDVGPAAG